jgi:hypothetical protein
MPIEPGQTYISSENIFLRPTARVASWGDPSPPVAMI